MASKDKKTIAIDKSLKIDQAQKMMFLWVCGASIVFGVTVVLIINFAQSIAYNNKLSDEIDKNIAGATHNQKSLQAINNDIDGSVDNERLEVVARSRSNVCDEALKKVSLGDADIANKYNINSTCTALRIIPDALPDTINDNALIASLMYILNSSNDRRGVRVESAGITSSDSDSSVSSESDTIGEYTISIEMKDDSTYIKNALIDLERSIRNFDFKAGTLNVSEDGSISLESVFYAYRAKHVQAEKQTRVVCADNKNEKCKNGTTGDQYGVPSGNSSSSEESEK